MVEIRADDAAVEAAERLVAAEHGEGAVLDLLQDVRLAVGLVDFGEMMRFVDGGVVVG